MQMEVAQSPQAVPLKKKSRFFKKEDIALYLMALPVTIFLIIFAYIPMLGLVMAFQNLDVSRGVFGSPFVGFRNFEFLFRTTDAYIITRNTILYNLAYITVNMFLAVTLSLLLSSLRSKNSTKVLQTVYMMPYFLSWAVVQIAVFAFLDRNRGLVNNTLELITGTRQLTNWYQNLRLWPPLLVGINAWKGVGFQTVLYLAVISGISSEYYEAAMIDGAGKLKQALYITIPHLRFIISISLIMAMGGIIRGDFGLHFTVTRDTGLLYPVVDIIDTYIFRGLTRLHNVGMSTAAGLYQSVVGFVMILAANWVVTKIDPDSAMF